MDPRIQIRIHTKISWIRNTVPAHIVFDVQLTWAGVSSSVWGTRTGILRTVPARRRHHPPGAASGRADPLAPGSRTAVPDQLTLCGGDNHKYSFLHQTRTRKKYWGHVCIFERIYDCLYRVADPHYFIAYPDPAFQAFHINADPDPAFHFNADLDPAPHQSDLNLRPLVCRPSRDPLCPWPSKEPFWAFKAGLALKNPPKKTHPKKPTQKNPKKPT